MSSFALKPRGKAALRTYNFALIRPFLEARPRCIVRRLFHDPPCYGKGTDKSVWLSFVRSQEETLAFSAGAGDGNVIKMYFLERDPASMKNETCPPLSPCPPSRTYYVRASRTRETRDRVYFSRGALEPGTCAIERSPTGKFVTRIGVTRQSVRT